jgi:hypothetical protein
MRANIFYTIAFIFLIASNLIGQQQAEKTLVKAFNLADHHVVYLDVDLQNDVVIHEWNQEQMRVVMTVSLGNGSDLMLKSLVKVGRYNLDSSMEPDMLRVFLPGLEREVKLRNGGELVENINFEIFAPSNVLVKTKTVDAVAEETKTSF